MPEARSSANGKVPARYPALGAGSSTARARHLPPGWASFDEKGQSSTPCLCSRCKGLPVAGVEKKKDEDARENKRPRSVAVGHFLLL